MGLKLMALAEKAGAKQLKIALQEHLAKRVQAMVERRKL